MKKEGILASAILGLLSLACYSTAQAGGFDVAQVAELAQAQKSQAVSSNSTDTANQDQEGSADKKLTHNQLLHKIIKPEGYNRLYYNKYGLVAIQTAQTPEDFEEVDMNIIADASIHNIIAYEKQKEEIARIAELEEARIAKEKADYAELNGLRVR